MIDEDILVGHFMATSQYGAVVVYNKYFFSFFSIILQFFSGSISVIMTSVLLTDLPCKITKSGLRDFFKDQNVSYLLHPLGSDRKSAIVEFLDVSSK